MIKKFITKFITDFQQLAITFSSYSALEATQSETLI